MPVYTQRELPGSCSEEEEEEEEEEDDEDELLDSGTDSL
tara:strand:+ start:464 stop:580 length:117 start_codon:yes stop_codon:yes gene_type:complete